MKNKEHQIIFSRALCNHLIQNGFNIAEVMGHKNRNTESVFFFEYSSDLKACINDFMKVHEKKGRE